MKLRQNTLASRKRSMYLQCYALIILPLIGFFVITLYPMLWAIAKSWYYYTGIPSETRFVGWDNFITLFTKDLSYFKSWGTTFKYALLEIPANIVVSLLLAVALYKKDLKGASFFRVVYFVPSIISVAIVGLVFTNIFDYFGVVNTIALKLGIVKERIEWFSNAKTALPALVVGGVWMSYGINMLYFLSALQNISKDLYEAASIDGATPVQTFFRITLPLIAPVFQIILLLEINGALHIGDYILVTTNGAPGGDTYTVMSYLTGVFAPGFAEINVNIGYGCALSFITSILMTIIAVVYLKVSKKLKNMY